MVLRGGFAWGPLFAGAKRVHTRHGVFADVLSCCSRSKIKTHTLIGNSEVQKLELQPETRVALTIQAYNVRTRICTCAYNRGIKRSERSALNPTPTPQVP
eukprot:2649208-Prymnesium_polylepis.1